MNERELSASSKVLDLKKEEPKEVHYQQKKIKEIGDQEANEQKKTN